MIYAEVAGEQLVLDFESVIRQDGFFILTAVEILIMVRATKRQEVYY